MAIVYLDIMVQDKFYKQLTYNYSEQFMIDADDVKAFVLKKLPTLKNKEFTIKFTNNKI